MGGLDNLNVPITSFIDASIHEKKPLNMINRVKSIIGIDMSISSNNSSNSKLSKFPGFQNRRNS
jgi:hypothetical protein